MPKRPLRARELFKKIRPYNIEVLKHRGKGYERILLLPKEEGSSKGPQYPIKYHGLGTEISIPVIDAILRRFNLDPDEFWS